MLAVKGVYDGQVVRLLEPVKVNQPYRVEVTFVDEIAQSAPLVNEDNLERFIGMWTASRIIAKIASGTFRLILRRFFGVDVLTYNVFCKTSWLSRLGRDYLEVLPADCQIRRSRPLREAGQSSGSVSRSSRMS